MYILYVDDIIFSVFSCPPCHCCRVIPGELAYCVRSRYDLVEVVMLRAGGRAGGRSKIVQFLVRHLTSATDVVLSVPVVYIVPVFCLPETAVAVLGVLIFIQ